MACMIPSFNHSTFLNLRIYILKLSISLDSFQHSNVNKSKV